MEAHLQVYAAAARAFEEDEGRWPEDLEELLSVLRRAPRGDRATTRIEGVEPAGETVLLPFLVERPGEEEGRPKIMGVVEVWPSSADEEHAARIHWELGDDRRQRFGSITMRSCGLGEYAAEQ